MNLLVQLAASTSRLMKLLTAALCTIITVSPLAQAQNSNHEGLYRVEMIVFSRHDDRGEEHWPDNLTLRYPNNWVVLQSLDGATASEPTSQIPLYQKLAPTERELNAQARRFTQNARFNLLFHEAWVQPIAHKRDAKSIVIAGGEKFGEHYALEGSIKLSVATYLKLETNLWYSQFDPNIGQTPSRAWPELPLMPTPIVATENDLLLDAEFDLANALAAENAQLNGADVDSTVSTPEFITRQIIHLTSERDMRSNELHYIDHPVVGIIIHVKPVQTQTP